MQPQHTLRVYYIPRRERHHSVGFYVQVFSGPKCRTGRVRVHALFVPTGQHELLLVPSSLVQAARGQVSIPSDGNLARALPGTPNVKANHWVNHKPKSGKHAYMDKEK